MKHNKSSKGNGSKQVVETYNENGVEAFRHKPELELLNMVSSWLVNEPKFYTSNDVENAKIITLIKKLCGSNPEFVAKLAVYCREVLYLRSAPVVILVHMALEPNSKQLVRKLVPRICTRADQMTEVIAYLKTVIGDIGDLTNVGSMPCSLKRGLADTFIRFDEEKLSRYDTRSEVKLRDIIMLTHPRPQTKSQERLFNRVITGDLESADTFQVTISKMGNNKEAWEKAMETMGVFGMIRNCSNFLKHGCDMTPVLEKLADKDAVRKARVYPHQILSAYRRIQNSADYDAPKVLRALEKAVEASLGNLPKIHGRTLLLGDHSPSMDAYISTGRSDESNELQLTRRDATNIAMAIAKKKCSDSVTAVFSKDVKVVQMSLDGTILQNAEMMNGKVISDGTDTPKAIDYFTENQIEFDRIIILTDDEPTNSTRSVEDAITDYRKKVNPNAFLHTVNFVGYGTQSVKNSRLNNNIAGFTERFLDLIPGFEDGMETQLDRVYAIKL